jgi:hypothetical protein
MSGPRVDRATRRGRTLAIEHERAHARDQLLSDQRNLIARVVDAKRPLAEDALIPMSTCSSTEAVPVVWPK